jgi:uncharacterized SAM-dependent methyltransferase
MKAPATGGKNVFIDAMNTGLLTAAAGNKYLSWDLCYAAVPRSALDVVGSKIKAELSKFVFIPGDKIIPGGPYFFVQLIGIAGYYLLKAEKSITLHWRDALREIVRKSCVVEFGPGDGRKTFDFFDTIGFPPTYFGIDIANEHCVSTKNLLRERMNKDTVGAHAISFFDSNFTDTINGKLKNIRRTRLGFIPGSTLGNFDLAGREKLLGTAATIVDEMLVAVDSTFDAVLTENAYGKPATGPAMAFNLNGLFYGGLELGVDMPITGMGNDFRYDMSMDYSTRRAKTGLVCMADRTYRVGSFLAAPTKGEETSKRRGKNAKQPYLRFGAFEEIHCVDSYKPSGEELAAMFHRTGWRIESVMPFRETLEDHIVAPSLPFPDRAMNERIAYNIYYLKKVPR